MVCSGHSQSTRLPKIPWWNAKVTEREFKRLQLLSHPCPHLPSALKGWVTLLGGEALLQLLRPIWCKKCILSIKEWENIASTGMFSLSGLLFHLHTCYSNVLSDGKCRNPLEYLKFQISPQTHVCEQKKKKPLKQGLHLIAVFMFALWEHLPPWKVVEFSSLPYEILATHSYYFAVSVLQYGLPPGNGVLSFKNEIVVIATPESCGTC